MQELMDKLQHILGTPEGQSQLNNIASLLNTNQTASQGEFSQQATQQQAPVSPSSQQSHQQAVNNTDFPQNNNFDLSGLASMFGGGNNSGDMNASVASLLSSLQGGTQAQAPPISGMPNIDVNMIMKLQQVFSKMNVNDKNSQLLYALKPHFSETRQKKVDQAISMMRLMSMLPALKESGIFSGL